MPFHIFTTVQIAMLHYADIHILKIPFKKFLLNYKVILVKLTTVNLCADEDNFIHSFIISFIFSIYRKAIGHSNI